jgi:hypothetical protein
LNRISERRIVATLKKSFCPDGIPRASATTSAKPAGIFRLPLHRTWIKGHTIDSATVQNSMRPRLT